MFAAENKELYRWVFRCIRPLLPADRTLPQDWFVGGGVLLFGAIGWLFAFLFTRGSHDDT